MNPATSPRATRARSLISGDDGVQQAAVASARDADDAHLRQRRQRARLLLLDRRLRGRHDDLGVERALELVGEPEPDAPGGLERGLLRLCLGQRHDLRPPARTVEQAAEIGLDQRPGPRRRSRAAAAEPTAVPAAAWNTSVPLSIRSAPLCSWSRARSSRRSTATICATESRSASTMRSACGPSSRGSSSATQTPSAP